MRGRDVMVANERDNFGRSVWAMLCSATEGTGKLRTAKGLLDEEVIAGLHLEES